MSAETPDQHSAVYTIAELVELFGGRRQRSALYEDVRRGAIPSMRLGRRLFVPGWFVEQLRNGERSDRGVISEPPTSPGGRP
jgi:hypothetical protein